jgi:membrane protein implicated in regulation of membrane protease activity
VGPEVVAHREVAALVVASGLADVQVMGARTLGREREEVKIRRVGVRDEQVSQSLERSAVLVHPLDAGHGHLQIDDRLCRQAGDRRRADVVEAHGHVAQLVRDAMDLRVGECGPVRVVVDDPDRRIEAVVE